MTKEIIHTLFLEVSERHCDNISFIYFDQKWKTVTYREFLTSSKAIASYLIKTGINKADRIAIISENRPEWCIAYMGIMMSGASAVPIDSQLSHEVIRNFLADCEAKVVFHSLKTEENIKEALDKLAALRIIQLNFDSSEFKKICGLEEKVHYPEIVPEDIASIIYTSGTTGVPKGVMLTHRNFCTDAKAAIKAGVINENDNVLSLLPLHHTYPFMCTFLVPVFLGAKVTYSPSLKGPDIIASVKDNSVTILIGVPQLLELIRNGITNKLKQLPFPASLLMKNIFKLCGIIRRKTDINVGKIIFRSAHTMLGKQFRFFTSGGAKLEPDIAKDLEAIGFTVLEGYGLTETSPVVTFNPVKKRIIGSVGKPLPSIEIKIVEPALDIEKEGEIAIKGSMVMKGYYKNPEATDQAIKDGWFLSGDLGYIDKNGYLFITGRRKEVIVLSSGKNVFPEEVEKEYLKIPLIKEICILGFEEKDRNISLHAVIVPDISYAKQQRIGNIHEALRWEISHISNSLPSYVRIKGFTLSSEQLPRTPLGKLRRFIIKDLIKQSAVLNQQSKEEDKALLADEIGRRIVNCITPILKEPFPIHSKDNLELDLGLDSLQRVELIVSLEKEFSIKVSDTFASDVHTVGELVERIKESTVISQESGVRVLTAEKGLAALLSQEPSDEEKRKVGLKQGAIEWIFVSFLMGIMKLLLKIFFRLDVKGIENTPDGPFIIAPNHFSNLDGFVIGAGVPLKTFRELYFQGFQKYFTSRLTALFAKLAHVIPIDPETYLSKALQISAYILRNKKSLCIFPEGGRSYDGKIMEFKKGIGILALKLNVPVVPAMIEGSFEALPKGTYWPRFSKIRLTFGKPLHPSDLDTTKRPDCIDEYQFFADVLREKVSALLFLP